MEQKSLILDAIHTVQEQYHGRLVVRAEVGCHIWLLLGLQPELSNMFFYYYYYKIT